MFRQFFDMFFGMVEPQDVHTFLGFQISLGEIGRSARRGKLAGDQSGERLFGAAKGGAGAGEEMDQQLQELDS